MTAHLDVKGHVARVVIDRPEVLNAVDEPTQRRLEGIWAQIEDDPRIRVVTLTGSGDRAFCTGADMKAGGNDGLDYWATPREGGFGGISVRRTLAVPVIARINGHALGGGFEMVLGCDLAVAVDDATFGLTEPLVGRVALDGGVPLLLQTLPRKLAADLLYTGRRLSAPEALSLGLVNEIVSRSGLDDAVERWIERLLRAAPLSHRAIKELSFTVPRPSAAEITGLATPAVVRALSSRDGIEGARAFRQKRRPTWTGA
jgi:crotonobetainyl-CoA hydratase